MSTALCCVFVDALCINARVGCTRGVVIAIGGNVTATFDGRIVADVIGRALIFSTCISIVTVCDNQAAVLLLRVLTVTCVEVTDLEGT